jgi:hypothetical protein
LIPTNEGRGLARRKKAGIILAKENQTSKNKELSHE